MPFTVAAVAAIVTGGLLAAAFAHAPTRHVMWTVAYMVLVVGMTQGALGIGQAVLATPPVSARFRAFQCLVLNAGHAGVIVGTLCASPLLVVAATAVFVVALGLFLYTVRRTRRGWAATAYRSLLALIGASAMVGVLLAALRTTH